MPLDCGLRLEQKADKRVLNRIARPVGITQQMRGITQELRLELLNGRAHKRIILMGAVGRWRVRIHVLLLL